MEATVALGLASSPQRRIMISYHHHSRQTEIQLGTARLSRDLQPWKTSAEGLAVGPELAANGLHPHCQPRQNGVAGDVGEADGQGAAGQGKFPRRPRKSMETMDRE
ncbi:unnamed protein product [Spirodela intermedia]|uniref:Uncharacterized protein n=1 Tax=Spirodela intermedia TaxID=51605 RepID=A0A7I8IF50_SPIIN|nr:unnamed protein product [Spirodela intermedia]CAA6656309.1 unnamed protein product [Spirodela intermedia]